MNKRNIIIGVGVVVMAIGWYAFWPELIFINKTVNEEFPGGADMGSIELGVKFGRDDMVNRFLKCSRTGFYCAVPREGEIGAGDVIEFLSRDQSKVIVAEIIRLYAFEGNDTAGLRRTSVAPALPESWRSYFRKQLGL